MTPIRCLYRAVSGTQAVPWGPQATGAGSNGQGAAKGEMKEGKRQVIKVRMNWPILIKY